MLVLCLLIAFSETNRRCASALLDRPSAISSRTSRSLGDSSASCSSRDRDYQPWFDDQRRLEVGYSARSGRALPAGLAQSPLSSMPVEYLTPAIEDRSVEVLTLLADRGSTRLPQSPT